MKSSEFGKSIDQSPALENYHPLTSDLSLQSAAEANGGARNNQKDEFVNPDEPGFRVFQANQGAETAFFIPSASLRCK
jgi:hypothetical protein